MSFFIEVIPVADNFDRNRKISYLAAVLPILAMLGGCGGGGGGGGGGGITNPSPGFLYPTLAAATSADTIQGAAGAYSRINNVMTPVPAGSTAGNVTVFVNTPSAGNT